jgi:Cu(I)/Ag(I) efflux system membrane fusion protein
MKKIKPILFIVIALIAGFFIRGFFTPSPPHPLSPEEQTAPETWTCSMHPQIQLPAFGKCPICFMDLIPLESGNDEGDEREISVSPYAAKLMELETTKVIRKFAEAELRMVGKVDYDETRVSTISSWVPGRIDRLFVDSTGIPVNEGEHLAEFYSPDLLTAQEELLQSIKHNPSLINPAREKLRLWGFTAEQVSEIETRGTASDHMTIYSPVSGIVIHKNAQEGMYVQTGSKIYTIADLSKVWIQLDAYESDINWLRYGSAVEFSTESYPGETFEGTISFIDPIINPATRTAKVRVIVENESGKLKPGMFVRAIARPQVGEDGRIMNPDLAGKWISPMHPEIVKDEPGPCDVCGMPLVTAESLGYVARDDDANAPLLIPVTAALKTGKRAVAYVEIPDQEKPTYEGREVTLGARLGDYYVVESGLNEGEHVVTRGAFKLDAELQIRAKPSMMSNPDEKLSSHPSEIQAQTTCPIMGGAINKDVFTDYNGMRIYFCCAGCDGEFKADPETYLAKMRAEGVEPEKLPQPQTLCPIMGGEINKDVFTDHNGMRIYFCCGGCDSAFLENPEKYIKQMRAEGIEPEKVEHNHVH